MTHQEDGMDCAHVLVETFGDGENGPSLWACADCRLRFYPACRTCVDVGHRNIEHPDPTPATEERSEPASDRRISTEPEGLLGGLDEDDVMYDYPVAMSGEPMDPVLFVRWDAVRAALATQSRGLDVEQEAALRADRSTEDEG
jgi:hypothetical protein